LPIARPAPARILIGWREWLGLPGLGVDCIRAKVDSGARSSSLHVLEQELFERDGRAHVRFIIEHGRSDELKHRAEAEVVDRRAVTDSGGHRQLRVFIRTRLSLPTGPSWLIDVNLTERHNMQFPMLLGRSALRRRCLVEPARSFLLGQPADTPDPP
jgi:hypothetical protein